MKRPTCVVFLMLLNFNNARASEIHEQGHIQGTEFFVFYEAGRPPAASAVGIPLTNIEGEYRVPAQSTHAGKADETIIRPFKTDEDGWASVEAVYRFSAYYDLDSASALCIKYPRGQFFVKVDGQWSECARARIPSRNARFFVEKVRLNGRK